MEFNFEKLSVYKKALDICSLIYTISKSFPEDEKFGLTAQLRRSAASISLNIAEGSSRKPKEFCRYLTIARGSVFECIAISEICRIQGFIDNIVYAKLKTVLAEISKMLSGLKKGLLKSSPSITHYP